MHIKGGAAAVIQRMMGHHREKECEKWSRHTGVEAMHYVR